MAWWLALGRLVCALECAIAMIGIPFAIQYVKLAGIALAPIGKTIVSSDETAARRRGRR